MKKIFHLHALLLALLVGGIGACAGQGMREDPDSLYQRLGGRKFLKVFSQDLVRVWIADPRLVGAGKKIPASEKTALERQVFDFFCWAGEGPCELEQGGLEAKLRGYGLSSTEWFYVLEGIVATLDRHHVPAEEKKAVLALVYALGANVLGQ